MSEAWHNVRISIIVIASIPRISGLSVWGCQDYLCQKSQDTRIILVRIPRIIHVRIPRIPGLPLLKSRGQYWHYLHILIIVTLPIIIIPVEILIWHVKYSADFDWVTEFYMEPELEVPKNIEWQEQISRTQKNKIKWILLWKLFAGPTSAC